MKEGVLRVAILASGSGTNAERLIQAVQISAEAEVVVLGTNRSKAGAVERAERRGVACWTFSKGELEQGEVTRRLLDMQVDFVALAGFLLKVPQGLVDEFPGRMLNLHPSLLPAFGGKGMYGHHVHRAVHEALQKGAIEETGITLHWVDSGYDTGLTFFQASAPLSMKDTTHSIAEKIQVLEKAHYAKQTLRAIRESLSLPGKTLD